MFKKTLYSSIELNSFIENVIVSIVSIQKHDCNALNKT